MVVKEEWSKLRHVSHSTLSDTYAIKGGIAQRLHCQEAGCMQSDRFPIAYSRSTKRPNPPLGVHDDFDFDLVVVGLYDS